MRLSMQILADWLNCGLTQTEIIGDSRVIRNVRPLSEGHSCTPNNVYVSATKDNGVMCINRNSVLYFRSADASQITNEIMDAFDFYNTWQDDLSQSLPELTLEELLQRSRKVLPGFLAVADPTYYTLAYDGLPDSAAEDSLLHSYARTRVIELSQIMELEQNPGIRKPTHRAYLLRSDCFHAEGSVRNLFLGDRHMGWLILSGEHITPGMMDLQDEVGDLIEGWLEYHTAMQDRLSRNSLFFDLLSGSRADEPRITAALMLLGIHTEDTKLLYRIEPSGSQCNTEILGRMNDISPCCHTLFFQKGLVSLFSGKASEVMQFETRLVGILAEADAVCGVSEPFFDILELATQHENASAALRYGNPAGRLVRFSDAVLPYTLHRLKESAMPWLIHPAIRLLQEYDAQNHTELEKTLRVYLQSERNYADTARALNVHRNSLLYRVERICDLTKVNLDDSDTRLHLLLSFAVL